MVRVEGKQRRGNQREEEMEEREYRDSIVERHTFLLVFHKETQGKMAKKLHTAKHTPAQDFELL